MDNSGELLAASLRPGNAGSNTTADHIDVLGRAIAQVPASHRRKLLIRADGAGASHGLRDWLTALNTAPAHRGRGRSMEYSVEFALTENVRAAITLVPKTAWTPAVAADATCVSMPTSRRSPACCPRRCGRRGRLGCGSSSAASTRTPGRRCPLFEHHYGWRYQAFVTNTQAGQVGLLEARHRARARVEDRIRVAKDTGLSRFPSREYAINKAWLTLLAIAAELTAWLRLLALPDELKTCEPRALRYRFLHVPARLTHGARRRHLRLPKTGPA